MNDMSALLNRVKFVPDQTLSWSDNKVVIIPQPLKTRHKRHRNAGHAEIVPLSCAEKPAAGQATGKFEIRIMLAGESAEERLAFCKSLQQSSTYNLIPVGVASGEEALRLIGQQQYDCILLDQQLSDMSGMQFLERRREASVGDGMPILKLLAAENLHLAAQAIRAGADEYLVKDSERHFLGLLPQLVQRMLDRQRLVQEKLQIETMYRALVEYVPVVSYIFSPANTDRLLYISPQIEQLGYPAGKWLSESGWRFKCMHEEDRQAVALAMDHCAQAGENFTCEYRLHSNNGKLHWFRDEAKAILDWNGQIRFYQGVMQDITALKLMENELQIHRSYQEQRVQERIAQLEKRITILVSCNSELCNQLEKQYQAAEELRKQKCRRETLLHSVAEAGRLANVFPS